MTITPFFSDMRSAYHAELDDLTFDSEGKDVLRQRLADKRKEIGFLVHMMESSPEMVAVVFHQAFTFDTPAAFDDLIGRDADDFPAWESLGASLSVAPWAAPLVDAVLAEPRGEWFLAVAAGLEYLAGKPGAAARAGESDDEDDDRHDDEEDAFDDEGHEGGDSDARSRKEAADDWMADQGFDRKD